MAKKNKPYVKKNYTLSQIKKGKEELLSIINEWDKDDKKRSTIMGLYSYALKWNNKDGGPKAKINKIQKTINGLKLINKRTPNDNILNLIKSYEKEIEVLQKELK
jgi:hypothetical protein